MATDAQIAANRINAQASTGPVSAAGQARVSQNALTSGLYSAGDFVRPEEHDLYAEFCDGFQTDLMPEGAIEQTLAAEVIHAAWRLRRCSVIEGGMIPNADTPNGDPSPDPLLDKTQQSIDRARAHAHRIFHRSLSELRRLQTERRLRGEASDLTKPGFTKQTQSSVTSPPAQPASISHDVPRNDIPRNAPCTCGSGLKFKRCCGKGAPAVLNRAA